jgi:hypothetical protein
MELFKLKLKQVYRTISTFLAIERNKIEAILFGNFLQKPF